MNRCLQEVRVPEWMTKGKITSIQKDPRKETPQTSKKTIMCLLMMWKILTAQIREEIYFSLTSCGLFLEEHKGFRKGSQDKGELLYIDQHIINENKTRRKNLYMAWIDSPKGIWYGPTKGDNNLSQNEQNIRWSHKLYQENHENLESGIVSRKEKLSWNKGSKSGIF